MKQLVIILVSPLVVALWCAEVASSARWTYEGQFHRVVENADRIIVKDGGFDCCHSVDKDKILFEVTDSNEIEEVLKNLVFEKFPIKGKCLCCGYPGIDWYKGKERLALTAVQHGEAIRWKDFSEDASLTKESREWLKKWLLKHGVLEEMK